MSYCVILEFSFVDCTCRISIRYILDINCFREKMAQAYDFALDKIGMDVMSYQIWVDYISFLKSV